MRARRPSRTAGHRTVVRGAREAMRLPGELRPTGRRRAPAYQSPTPLPVICRTAGVRITRIRDFEQIAVKGVCDIGTGLRTGLLAIGPRTAPGRTVRAGARHQERAAHAPGAHHRPNGARTAPPRHHTAPSAPWPRTTAPGVDSTRWTPPHRLSGGGWHRLGLGLARTAGHHVGVTPVTDEIGLERKVKEESGAGCQWPLDDGQGVGSHGGPGPYAHPRTGRTTADPAASGRRNPRIR